MYLRCLKMNIFDSHCKILSGPGCQASSVIWKNWGKSEKVYDLPIGVLISDVLIN